ncbi:MAG: hypothetical protein OEV28_08140, partial [Nitrospirota bacterium]|nr:hypothetical protein [Nitrospirota bacterium]
MEKNNLTPMLERTSLIRGIYRSLIQQGRAYAAFDPKRVGPLIDKLGQHEIIFDPMSGYGGLITLCAKAKTLKSAYCIEYNPPAYLWQILINPCHAEKMLTIIDHISKVRRKWPVMNRRAT